MIIMNREDNKEKADKIKKDKIKKLIK